MTSAPAIGLDYRPSRLPAGLLGAMLALALVAIALSGLGIALKLLVATIACVAAVRSAHRSLRSTVTGLGTGEGWRIYRAQAEEPAILLSHRVIGPVLLLRLRAAAGIEVVVLAPDNCDADIRRRLRMRLAGARHAARLH